jgi:hypothetical protein
MMVMGIMVAGLRCNWRAVNTNKVPRWQSRDKKRRREAKFARRSVAALHNLWCMVGRRGALARTMT